MKFKSNGDIDLSDPQTVEELKGGDVITTKVDKEAEATEKAIKQAKGAKLTLNLNAAENAQLTRMASVQNKSVKDFLMSKIHELLLDGNVGMPLISGPSKFSGTAVGGKKVSAPTNSFGRML